MKRRSSLLIVGLCAISATLAAVAVQAIEKRQSAAQQPAVSKQLSDVATVVTPCLLAARR